MSHVLHSSLLNSSAVRLHSLKTFQNVKPTRLLLCYSRPLVRHKGGVLQHRKPRWFPVGPTKAFKLPPKDHTWPKEQEQFNFLSVLYQQRLSSVVQMLYEDNLKSSDVGENARIEAEKLAKLIERRIEENDEENGRVAERRQQRLKEERVEKLKRIEEEVKERNEMEERKLSMAMEEIERTENRLRDGIRRDDLKTAIEKALERPEDLEFAIDNDGFKYCGRYLRSNEAKEADKIRMEAPIDQLQERLKQPFGVSTHS